jgi:membrane-associated phospholipid phosphatase
MMKQLMPDTKIASAWAWFIPLVPLALAAAIYFGDLQTITFLTINQHTQLLPDTIWAWLTFLGNGWGIFALCFPLLLLAPRLMSACIFSATIAGIISAIVKPYLDMPRPASILGLDDFYRIGEPLLHKAMPSGHTITAFAVASALYFGSDKRSRSITWIVLLVAALVGISRNAIGAHWLTDVLVGAAIGLWCGLIGVYLAQYIPEKQLVCNKPWPRLIAIGGLVSIYSLSTKQLDLVLNQPLQFACVVLISITLVFFLKFQRVRTS